MDWGRFTAIAAKVAREMAAKWAIVETDDVHQEIMLHAVKQADYLATKQDDEEFLRKVAWRAAKRYGSRERNHRDLTDGQYYYTAEEARAALRSFAYTDEEIGAHLGAKDDLTQTRISDNIVSARLDATAALRKLTDTYRDVLTRLYVYGLPAKSDADRRTAYRASAALAIAMNSHLRTTARK